MIPSPPTRQEIGIGRFALMVLAVTAVLDGAVVLIGLGIGGGSEAWRTVVNIACIALAPGFAYLLVRSRYRFDSDDE